MIKCQLKKGLTPANYDCVRADEIQDSGLIDKSMYVLLMKADLVVADISTYNPNAIYELGIRHAVRPFSTIILKEKEGKIPFDLDHNRIFMYSHLGEDIGVDEANRCKKDLTDLIKSISKTKKTDSPLYEFIKEIKPPQLPQKEYLSIINDLAKQEKHIFAFVEKAKETMKNNDFINASLFWEKASTLAPNESYFIQQRALCAYKSEKPSKETALIDALKIIEKLNPDGETNDPETLGITGAIYKQLYILNEDIEELERAIKYYGKCFEIRNDYYTGENYALCLNLKAKSEKNNDEKIFARVSAAKVRKKIVETLTNIEKDEDFNKRIDKKWIYATLSHCYLAIKDQNLHDKYEKLFLAQSNSEWEQTTYQNNKKLLKKIIGEK